MRIGIIAAIDVEIEAIRHQLKNSSESSHSGITFYKGMINETEVVLLSAGIGKVNAAISTQLLIDRFAVDLVINTGIAGSLDERVKHFSIVIAEKITYHDVRKTQMRGAFPFQEWFKCDPFLVGILEQYSDSDSTMIGKVITGDDFISDAQKKKQIKEDYDALCVEMEGAAIAHAAFVNQIPFVIVRCISDLAEDESGQDYARHEKDAAHKVAQLVCQSVPEIMKRWESTIIK